MDRLRADAGDVSSISSLGDPTWVATYAAGNPAFADMAEATATEQETLASLFAPQLTLDTSAFFAPSATLDPSITAAANSELAAAAGSDPLLAAQMEALSTESGLVDLFA